MIRTPLSTTYIARSARYLLVAATMTITTAMIGGGLQSPTAAHAKTLHPANTLAASRVQLFAHNFRPYAHGFRSYVYSW